MKSTTIDLARIVARRHDTRTFQAACIFWGTLGLALALCTVVIAGFSLKGIAARDAQTSPQYGTATPIGRYMDTFATSPLNVYLMQANFPAAPKPPGIPGWPKPGEAYISPELARNYPVGEDSPWGRIAGVIDANSLMNLNEQSVMANPEHYTIPSARGYDITGWSDTQGFRGDHRTNKDTPQVVLLICLILVVPAIFLLVIATQLNSNTVRQQLRIFEGMGAGPSFRWKVSYFSSIAPATIALLVVAAALAIMRLSAPVYIPFAAVYLVQNDLEAATSALILTLIATLLICCGITYLNTSASSRPKAPNNADTRKPLNPYTALIMPASAFAWWLIPQFDFPIFFTSLTVLTMIGLFIYSTPYVVAAATTGLSRLALRGSTAVSVIGGRTLAANTRTAYVIGFGIVVSMILFNVPLLFASYFGDVVTRAITVNEHVNSASVMVRAPATTAPALQALIKNPSIEVLPIDFNYNSKSAGGTLVVNCDTAKRLGAHNCHSGLQSVSALTKTALEASTEFTPESFIVSQSYADKEHAQFMLVSTNRQPIAQEQLNSRLFSYRINVRQVGDEWAGSATFQVHQLRWFTFFAVPGTLMLTSGFAIGAWVRLRRQILTMQPILINEPGPRMLLTITLSGLLTPLALASLIGVGASGIMNWILSQQYEGLRLQPVPILTVGATGLVVAILAWAVVSASASQTHDSLTRKVTPDA